MKQKKFPLKTQPNEKRKKKYSRPKLTEYGSVAKLTQGSASSGRDFGGGFRN